MSKFRGIKNNREVLLKYLENEMYMNMFPLIDTEEDENLKLDFLKEVFQMRHFVIMILYVENLLQKASRNHPDGDLPKALYVEIVSKFIISFCQSFMDLNCLKESAKSLIPKYGGPNDELRALVSLLDKNLYSEEIMETVLQYLNSMDFSKLPSPKYLFGSLQEIQFGSKLTLSKSDWALKREQSLDHIKTGLIGSGLVRGSHTLFDF